MQMYLLCTKEKKIRDKRNSFISLISIFLVLISNTFNAKKAYSEPLDPLPTVHVETEKSPLTLEMIENFLNALQTLSATFSQISADGSVSQGNVFIERPGKVRFQYEENIPILIVSDGKILNFIDYEVSQITRWPIAETPLAPLVQKFFSFSKNVEVELGAGSVAGWTTVAISNAKNSERGKLKLIFTGTDTSNLEILAWEITDAQGAKTYIALKDTKVNIKLDEKLWTFQDPRGERFKRQRIN